MDIMDWLLFLFKVFYRVDWNFGVLLEDKCAGCGFWHAGGM